MKLNSITLVALLSGFALAGTAIAQGRHDDRPHGYDKAKAQAMAAGNSETVKTTGSGGRHDEKPHNATKKITSATTTAKQTSATPAGTDTAKTAQ